MIGNLLLSQYLNLFIQRGTALNRTGSVPGGVRSGTGSVPGAARGGTGSVTGAARGDTGSVSGAAGGDTGSVPGGAVSSGVENGAFSQLTSALSQVFMQTTNHEQPQQNVADLLAGLGDSFAIPDDNCKFRMAF